MPRFTYTKTVRLVLPKGVFFMSKLYQKINKSLISGFMVIGLLWNSSTLPFLNEIEKEINKLIVPIAKMEVIATAYTSTPEQTDSTPFTTASNKEVYDGLIAANFLDFGTKIRIPEIFGDKIFTVDDRMHRRFNKSKRIDVWFPTLLAAKKFGVKNLQIEVLN